MLEVVAVADKAYTQVLKNFPDFLTGVVLPLLW